MTAQIVASGGRAVLGVGNKSLMCFATLLRAGDQSCRRGESWQSVVHLRSGPANRRCCNSWGLSPSAAVRASLLHPQATSPAPSTHLRPRMPRHAAAHCSYTLPVTLPSPLAGHGAPSAQSHTIIRAAIDIYTLCCAYSCSLMLVAVVVCGAGARNNVCCMHT